MWRETVLAVLRFAAAVAFGLAVWLERAFDLGAGFVALLARDVVFAMDFDLLALKVVSTGPQSQVPGRTFRTVLGNPTETDFVRSYALAAVSIELETGLAGLRVAVSLR
jgi:hypothetical protein